MPPLIAATINPVVAGERYFVDFRARPDVILGHTFIVYGRLDDDGHAVDAQYANLYPKGGGKGALFIAALKSVRAELPRISRSGPASAIGDD